MGCTSAYIFCRVELPVTSLSSLIASHVLCLQVERGWLIILFTHHVCLPNANTTWVFIQHHQFHYCFNIPVVDLTADVILTKLENCEMGLSHSISDRDVKELSPCPVFSLLCNLDNTVEQQIGELIAQWNLSFSFFINFYWNIALQGCVSFWCTAK